MPSALYLYVRPFCLALLFGYVVMPTSTVSPPSSRTPHHQQKVATGIAVAHRSWTWRKLGAMMSSKSDVRDCILLFGAFCNGNLGDVIQPTAMEHLLASVAPDQCFWYAHPWVEGYDQGHHVGDFFSDNISGDASRLIHLTPEHAKEVNRFKALIVGGGGIFAAKHAPLDKDMFAEALTLPVIVMGVGANSYRSRKYTTLLEKAAFVSGRDRPSVDALTSVLQRHEDSATKTGDVALVRDPVLSDSMLTDREGTCWKQSEGEHDQPLCFVLPASNTQVSEKMHQHLLARVVKPGDVFVNVFPKHQEEILLKHDYPGEILTILDPMEFMDRLCPCRAIISTRFHGVILGLHMGVPTFGASSVSYGNKVPDVLINTMSLPEQYLTIDEKLTRDVVDQEVGVVRNMYANHNRRSSIFARLSSFHEDFKAQAEHVLFDIIGIKHQNEQEKVHESGHHQWKTFSSRDETEDFLSTPFAKGRLDAVQTDTLSSVPSGDRETVAKVVADETIVDKDTHDHITDGGATEKGGKKHWRSAEERGEPGHIQASAAAGTNWGAGIAVEHAVAKAKQTRSEPVPPPPPTAIVVRRSPVVKSGEAAAAISPKNEAFTLEELIGSVDVTKKEVEEDEQEEEEGEKRSLPLADALLANVDLFNESEEEAVEVEDAESLRLPKTSLAGTGSSKLRAEGDKPTTAEKLPLSGSIFKDGGYAAVAGRKRGGDPGETSAVGYGHRISKSRDHVTTTTKTSSGPEMVNSADSDVPALAVGEGTTSDDKFNGVLFSDHYVVGTVLLLAVIGIALLPSTGAPRMVLHDNLSAKAAATGTQVVGGTSPTDNDEDSRTSSDSELGVPSKRQSSTVVERSVSARTTVVAPTSSMMLLMLNFVMWVCLAMGFSAYGKVYLSHTRDPVGLLALQGITGVLGLCLLGSFGALDLRQGKHPTPAAFRQIQMASVLHTGQALLTNFSVLLGGVAITNALKATEPVAAAVFSYFLLGKTCTPPRMAALTTIVVGIFLLTFKGNNAGTSGGGEHLFASAVFATAAVCCNALRNVVIKKGDPIPPHQTLFACSVAATVIGVGLMLVRLMCRSMDDLRGLRFSTGTREGDDGGIGHVFAVDWLRMDGVNAALCFVGYSLASFNLLARLSPVGHAVGNSCKRMLVFSSGFIFLGEVLSAQQVCGTAVALTGVLAYNIAGTW